MPVTCSAFIKTAIINKAIPYCRDSVPIFSRLIAFPFSIQVIYRKERIILFEMLFI